MTRERIVLTDRGWSDAQLEREICETAGYELIDLEIPADEEALIEAVSAADPIGILFCWAPVTSRVLAAAPRLRVATRLGVGLDNIDLDYAANNAVTVTRVPDYCVDEVSDHVVGLTHAWARGIPALDRDIRSGRWQPGKLELRRIRDLTIGVWGLGSIGTAVANKFMALGCNVIAYNRTPGREPAGVGGVEVHELLEQSDVVTLHIPATPGLPPIIGTDELASMRPGSLLINTARGALVDVDAAVAGLELNRPGAIAFDVLATEPQVPAVLREALDGPLGDRIIITPHVAFSSTASVRELRISATEDLLRVLRGEAPHNPVALPVSPSEY